MANADDNRLARMKEGLLVQDACNPSGVAHSLVNMMTQIREDHGDSFSTNMLGKDPGVILLVAKLADLCRIDVSWTEGPVADAYREANLAEAPPEQGEMIEYRCTRLKPYYDINCPGREDPSSRQGYYITARSMVDAFAEMYRDHPEDVEWAKERGIEEPFTCEVWKQ